MKTVEGQLDETLLTDRLIALLSAGFGLLATVLASVGLYGVMAFVVARRSKELGVRLALGAQPGGVMWMVMREVLVLLAIGLAVGMPAALAAAGSSRRSSTASSRRIRRSPSRRWYVERGLVARRTDSGARASRIDPILALRYE